MNALPIPNTQAALAFLQAAHPNGPYHLVAIAEGGGIEARTFDVAQVHEMQAWIEERQGKRNLYWHVNELRPEARDIKAKKQDVARAVYMHVDIDDEDALERIKSYNPRPTAVVFSGGGYQAFWRLSEPSTDLERVERCNRKIAQDLGGDNCHNIDRIMRLPGTINVPNKKKRSVGRTEALAHAFPFLAGTRISEQLGLLWEDVDFEHNLIRICRIQERDGSLTETTKTEAGLREVPMAPSLRELLLAWRLVCPRDEGKLVRVFPGPGRLQQWPLPRKNGGGPLLYQNYRKRFWVPAFKRLKLPYVTPHAARHSFISILQSQGVEVGLVAKLAGHANPTVTLGHYTQAVRGGADAISGLERAFDQVKEVSHG